ncbi:MAG: hypothetical protein KZQ76_00395 [Candidatus Thiodiazotropha sp. (ex Epidulcina cf. delphinae)]|nr:hypothetical protein [Candidatus Thiodiazotropha sp. (ex Epidulcina cf. delphinae)]
MDIDLHDRIWPKYTHNWFKAIHDAPVPHNFDADNVKAMEEIKIYLQSNGLTISPNWMPNSVFHENMKRWIGYCSAPHHTLNGATPTQPFYMSFFPFVFEVGVSVFIGKFDSYITRPNFLEFGNTIVIRQDEPKIVELCVEGILERLLRFENPKDGFIYKVLINDDGESNIGEMGFEESGDFRLCMKKGLTDKTITDINNPYVDITSDRSSRIQEMRTYLARADSYIRLDVENIDGKTYLQFRQKSYDEVTSQGEKNTGDNKDQGEPYKPQESQQRRSQAATINKGPVFQGGAFSNVIVGDHATQYNDHDDTENSVKK